MPVVIIPSLMQDLAPGVSQVDVPGATVRQAIDQLDVRFPGIRERLCQGERLRPNIAVVVDGVISQQRLSHPLKATSQVRFIPALSGG